MIPRQTLFGLLTTVALIGVADAKPPGEGGPLSDGREFDPVARDSYSPVPMGAPDQDSAPARTAEKPGDTAGGFFAAVGKAVCRSGRTFAPGT